MGVANEPTIKDSNEDDYTQVTFQPDLKKFKMDKLDDDTVALMARRAYDVSDRLKEAKIKKHLFLCFQQNRLLRVHRVSKFT